MSLATRLRANLPVLGLIAVSGAIAGVWFSRGNFVFFIDNFFPFNPPRDIGLYSSAWSDYNGVGTINITNYPLLPIILVVWVFHDGLLLPLWASQAALFTLVMSVGASFMLLFVRELSFDEEPERTVAGLTAAVFYLFNPVFLDLYWYLNFPGAAGLFAGIPMMAYFALRGARAAQEGRTDPRALLGLAIGSVIASSSEVPYVVSGALIMLALYGALIVRTYRDRAGLRRTFKFSGVSALVLLGANAYWMVPELLITSYVSGPNAYSAAVDTSILTGNSALATFGNVVSLRYFPISNSFATWTAAYAAPTPTIAFAVAAMLALMFIGAISAWPRLRQLRYPGVILAFAGVFALLTVLLMGNNPSNPLAGLYLDVFNSSLVLQAFLRGPYLTWGNAYAFVVSVLAGVGTGSAVRYLTRSKRPLPLLSTPDLSWLHRFRPRRVSSGVVIAVALAAALTLGWPFWTGAAVSELNQPATPVFPGATYDLANYLAASGTNGTDLVFPPSPSLVAENFSGGGYLGPPYLGSISGQPTIQYVGPPLGSDPDYLLPLASVLPSLNATTSYAHLFELLGVRHVVVDGYAVPNSYASWSDPTPMIDSLADQANISLAHTFGNYSVFDVAGANPRVYAADTTLPTSGTIEPAFSVNLNYSSSAANNTDESSMGYFTTSASVANASPSSFGIVEFWPNLYSREHNGTGFHYPGWPEVVNTAPLGIHVGDFPFLTVSIRITTGSTQPIVSLASVPRLVVYPNDFDRTIRQFFSAPLVNSTFDAGNDTYRMTFDLASSQTLNHLPGGLLQHIMIQLQPGNGYAGYINGTVSLTFDRYSLTNPAFVPARSAVVPDNISREDAAPLATLSRPAVGFTEVDPSTYDVHLSELRGSTLLVLLQEFDPHWTLSSSDATLTASHFLVDGFANGWLIASHDPNVTLELRFSYETLTTAVQVVTGLTFVGLGVAVAFQRWPVIPRRIRSLAERSLRRLRLPRAPRGEPPSS